VFFCISVRPLIQSLRCLLRQAFNISISLEDIFSEKEQYSMCPRLLRQISRSWICCAFSTWLIKFLIILCILWLVSLFILDDLIICHLTNSSLICSKKETSSYNIGNYIFRHFTQLATLEYKCCNTLIFSIPVWVIYHLSFPSRGPFVEFVIWIIRTMEVTDFAWAGEIRNSSHQWDQKPSFHQWQNQNALQRHQ